MAIANGVGRPEHRRPAVLRHHRPADRAQLPVHDLRPGRRRPERRPARSAASPTRSTRPAARSRPDQPGHDHLGDRLDHQPQRRDPRRRHRRDAGRDVDDHGHRDRPGRRTPRPPRPSQVTVGTATHAVPADGVPGRRRRSSATTPDHRSQLSRQRPTPPSRNNPASTTPTITTRTRWSRQPAARHDHGFNATTGTLTYTADRRASSGIDTFTYQAVNTAAGRPRLGARATSPP